MGHDLESLKRYRDMLNKAIAEEEAKQVAIGSLSWAAQMLKDGYSMCREEWSDKTARYYVKDGIVYLASSASPGGVAIGSFAGKMLNRFFRSDWKIYEPKPNYQVGDWVEYADGARTGQALIMRMYNDLYVAMDNCYSKYEFVVNKKYITRKLKPSEVVLDFGSGIKGHIETNTCECCKDKVFMVRLQDGRFIEIPFDILTEPMKSIVKSLMERQGKKGEE